MGLPNPSSETRFSGANGDREILIFPVQLTPSRIGNLTRLILLLLYVMTIHTYKYMGLCIMLPLELHRAFYTFWSHSLGDPENIFQHFLFPPGDLIIHCPINVRVSGPVGFLFRILHSEKVLSSFRA